MYSRTSVPVTVDGYDFPAESSFAIHNMGMGRYAKEWGFKDDDIDPSAFRHERWAEEGLYSRVTTHNVFNPLGGGQRRCPGIVLGQEEVRMVLATILTDYAFEASEHHDMDFKAALTLGSRYGAWVKVRKTSEYLKKCGGGSEYSSTGSTINILFP
ncbi:hypothetical protein SARC_04151 [Sphaeroforma arctica JP610]|uniref:Cytochrome P450 n=1 Tax=Sphaeroforma arctica JP610 TaxID=667725 RepID=A0A0L0G482_9EUKA|nr:hypothetical protein SARC_04151 [Sphaeroforma arctica JP610]KNC83616.1 hypothetical protein SARC_04151 [Sphaeroforma arctica JP610]|eukprot:XP_014157518.1 hypothetical protein SARC_04151 [Sphaeroforma arctica JP610]